MTPMERIAKAKEARADGQRNRQGHSPVFGGRDHDQLLPSSQELRAAAQSGELILPQMTARHSEVISRLTWYARQLADYLDSRKP